MKQPLGRLVHQETGHGPDILQAKVLPITERTATIPVEWTVVAPAEVG